MWQQEDVCGIDYKINYNAHVHGDDNDDVTQCNSGLTDVYMDDIVSGTED